MRRAHKVDNNHAEIRDGLRKCGYIVFDASRMGSGFPDLVVRAYDQIFMLEVKQPGERLTPDEVNFFNAFSGAGAYIVHNLEEALDFFRLSIA